MLTPERALAATDVERPVDQPALHPGCLGERRRDGRVDLFVHAGDARQDRGPHLRDGPSDLERVGEKRDRVALVGAGEVHEAPEVVREREVEEHHVAGVGALR